MTASRYEYRFDPDKPNDTAASVFQLAREGGVSVLDLGSGPGIVSGALVMLADKQVTCVDAEGSHLEAAAERGVQRTIRSDLTSDDWLDQLAGERFDVIILADVLEHLVDPGALLATILEADLLARDGYLVISIPNASHISILGALAAGDFPYRPTGLLDATHLRFFTLKSFRRLLEEQGFGIDRIRRTTRALQSTELADVTTTLSPELAKALRDQHEEQDTYQYVLRAQPLVHGAGSAGAAELRDLRRRVGKAERGRQKAKTKLRKEQKKVAALEARLDEVKRSATWRTGRVLVAPSAALKRLLRRS